MHRRILIFLTSGVVAVAGCGQGDATPAVTSGPATTQPPVATSEASTTVPVAAAATTDATQPTPLAGGCDVLHEPGEYEGVGRYGDVEQPYWMVVPETYAEVAPAPLYLHLASGGGDHDSFLEGWRPYLDDLNGLMAIVNTSLGAPPPGRSSPETTVALIDQVSSDYCVDPSRIFIMGPSSSSGLAERLACDASDRIAAFIAAFGGGSTMPCTPQRPVPLLSFTGDDDRSGVTALVNRWVERNGCDPEPVVEDLGSGVLRKTYQNCEADIVFYDIEGMGHTWPVHEVKGPGSIWIAEYEEVDYFEEAYAFFEEHPLP